MNTVQNGKGDRARNNWGEGWYAGFAAIHWDRKGQEREDAPEKDSSGRGANPAPGPASLCKNSRLSGPAGPAGGRGLVSRP